MPRFLLPVAVLLAGTLLLAAGTLGDLRSWGGGLPNAISTVSDLLPFGRQASPSPPARSETVSERDQLRREVQDLRARIAQQKQDVAEAHAAADQTRRELTALREQRQREASTSPAPRVGMAREAATAAPVVPDPEAQTPGGPATVPVVPAAEGPAPNPAASAAGGPADPGAHAIPASERPATPARLPATNRTPAVRHLMEARTALTSGRRARARWLLGLTRNQMAHGLPTPPGDAAGNLPATQVRYAINLLNRGDSDGALRAINEALAASDPEKPDVARQNYRASGEPGAH